MCFLIEGALTKLKLLKNNGKNYCGKTLWFGWMPTCKIKWYLRIRCTGLSKYDPRGRECCSFDCWFWNLKEYQFETSYKSMWYFCLWSMLTLQQVLTRPHQWSSNNIVLAQTQLREALGKRCVTWPCSCLRMWGLQFPSTVRLGQNSGMTAIVSTTMPKDLVNANGRQTPPKSVDCRFHL